MIIAIIMGINKKYSGKHSMAHIILLYHGCIRPHPLAHPASHIVIAKLFVITFLIYYNLFSKREIKNYIINYWILNAKSILKQFRDYKKIFDF